MRRLKLQAWQVHSGVLASYILFSLLLFLPVLPHATTAVGMAGEGTPDDAWHFVWMLWWFQRAVATAQNPFFTTMIFYPTGTGFFWQTLTSPNGLLALPISTFFNAILSFNLLAMTTFWLSGYTMYLLARRLVGAHWAAWIAGLLFAFSPYHLSKLYDGQLEVMSIQFFPLLVLWLHYGLGDRRWRYVLLSGLLLVWITLTSLYYGLFSVLYIGLYAALLLVRQWSWSNLGQLGQRGLVVGLPLLVVLAPYLAGYSSGSDLPDWQRTLHSAQPLDFFLPSPFNPLWGDQVARLQAAWHPGVGAINISLGVMVWVLALTGIALLRRRVWFWTVLLGLLMIFAMGTVLVVNGRETGLPLPYALLTLLPAVKLGQRPNHIMAVGSVLVALLAAWGWQALGQRIPPRLRRGAATVALLLIAIDLWPQPLKVAVLDVSPFFRQITPNAPGAIFEFPFEKNASGPFQAQLIHHRPIFGAYLARLPNYPFVEYTDGVRQLWHLGKPQNSIVYPDWSQALVPTLAAYDVEYIVLYKNRVHPDDRAEVEARRIVLAERLAVVYDDTELTAYRRPSDVYPAAHLALGQGWHELEVRDDERWQWTGGTAELVIMNPDDASRAVFLDAELATLEPSQPISLYQQVGTGWRHVLTVEGNTEPRLYRVSLELAAGRTVLRWATVAKQEVVGGKTTRELGVQFMGLSLRTVGVE